MKILQALLLVLCITAASAETLQIFSASTFLGTPASTLSGSLQGGRTIYIQGVGFPSNPSLLQVWVGSYPCKIPADGVTPTALSCETTTSYSAVDVKSLTIKIVSEGQVYTVPSTTFNYIASDTPYISNVFPSSSVGGTRLHFYAQHRVLNFGDGLRDMGDFIGLYVGDTLCSMFDITQTGGINYNSVTRAMCDQALSQQAGRYNISEHVVAGWAAKQHTMRKPSLGQIYYEHTIFPAVYEISPNSGFDTGQTLQIYGSGFSNDASKLQVEVDGVVCDVLSSTLSQVNCRLRPKQISDSGLISVQNSTAQTKGYIGGSGFDYSRYDISALSTATIAGFKAALIAGSGLTLKESKSVMQLQTPDIYGQNYGQVFKGYFYAPVDGNYTFVGSGDDSFQLLMNPEYGTSTGPLDRVIFTNSAVSSIENYYINNVSSLFGAPRLLQAGKYYYTQLYHINNAGTGFLKVSVQVPNSDTTLPKQTYEVNHFETSFINDPQILQFTLNNAVSGTFNLSVTRINSATLQVSYNKEVTISHSATASQFQSAINQFDSYSSAGITCTGAVAYDALGSVVPLTDSTKIKTVWTLSISRLRSTTQIAQRFKFKGNNLANATSTTASWSQTTIQNHCPLISGTFTMDIGGQPVRIYDTASKTYSIFNIPYNVAASALQAALRQIIGFESVEVFRSSAAPQYGTKWIISYIQYFNDVPDIVFSASKLTGGLAGTYPQMGFYETRKYSTSILFNPVNEWFMFSADSTPQVIVKVNDISSVCSGDCSYSFISTTPFVTSQTKSVNGVTVSVAITDPAGLSYPNSDLTIKVDGQICTIASGTYTAFSCNLPTNTNGSPKIKAGLYNVEVFIANKGFVRIQSGVAKLNYDIVLSSLSPNTGGTNGGYTVNINGAGFPSSIQPLRVSLCGSNAHILQTSNTLTKIIVPKCNTAGPTDLSYTYNNITKTISFSYSTSTVNATITQITPTSFSPVKKGVMNIIGTDFTAPQSAITVFLTNATGKVYQMRVISSNDTVIQCGIPGGLAGVYRVQVNFAGVGTIAPVNDSVNVFTYELVVTGITPTSGPYYGGTLVTINGINFSPDLLQNYVSIGNQLNTLCSIQTLTPTQIRCRMPPTHPDWTSSQQNLIVTNRIVQDSACPGNNCQFTYSTKELSPNLTKISAASALSGKGTLLLTGFNLNATNNVDVKVVLENKVSGVKTPISVNMVNQTNVNFTIPNVPSGSYLVRVRLDPLGETNSIVLALRASLNSTSLTGSTKGTSVILAGYGLPTQWPSNLYSLVLTQNSIPIAVKVMSTQVSKMQIFVPESLDPTTTSITLKDPLDNTVTASLTQNAASTPTISIQTSSPITSGLSTIQLNRTNLATKLPRSIKIYNVLNKDKEYNVPTWTYNGTFIQFGFNFKAGRYGVNVWVQGNGLASITQTIDVNEATTYQAAVYNVSINGGRILVNGSDISPDAVINVGGYAGKVVQTTSTYSVFEIPPLITPETVTQYPEIFKQQVIQPSAIVSDGGVSPSSAFDKIQSSFYSSAAAVCYIGLDAGAGKVINVRRVRYFPYYKWAVAAKFIKGAVIEGSNDGSSFTILATVDQTVHSGWNSIKITTSNNYRFIRLRHTSASACKLSEFEVIGVAYNDLTISTIDSFITDANFNDGFNTYNFNGSINYRNQSTPVVLQITPNTADVFGGDVITFTGLNFVVGTPYVSIDGVECDVNQTSMNQTFFECTTGSRLTLPQQNSFVVRFGNQNPVMKDEFSYVMRWSDIRTWGTDLPPVEGDLVYVPKGMTLYVDQSTPRLDGIIVEDGRLIFADQSNMEIHTNLITVNRGEFRAGTQDKPYQHQLTFIMYGNYNGKQQPMFGNKGIGCLECKFSMHGEPRVKTWTLLSSTIMVNTAVLTVDDAVDWRIGEEIVVASTGFDHNEAEQRRITNITGNQITVDRPFEFQHLGTVENYGTNRLQLKAQVGLLTRNIKMMGDPTSEAGIYGSHLMMAGRAQNGLVAHIAYTQFTHCGQPRIVGRYCIHFHMNGDVPDSYAKGNAVHHSFARVITIHGVHYLRITQNVGYRVKGHNFFVEDGIETHNLLEYNLAIGSLATQNMMQTDMSVASFWITNPTNDVRFNRAAGGDFYGFWYEIKPNPDGPSSTTDICPIGNPLGDSHDNVAHSYKRFGLRIFKLYSREIPCDPIKDDSLADPWTNNPSVQSRFYNYLTYKNGESGLLAEETGNMIFENFTIADSKLAGMQFYRCNLTRQLVIARDMAIIGCSSSCNPSDVAGTRGVIAPRTSGWKMSNIRFYNYPTTTVVMETCSKCDQVLLYTNTAQQYEIQQILLTNITGNYLFMKGQKRQIIYDLDASFASNFDSVSRTSATIVWKFPHLQQETAACKASTAAAKWDNALVCDQTVTLRKVMFTNLLNANTFNSVPIKIQKIADQTQVVSNTSTLFTSFLSLQLGMQSKDKANSYSVAYITDRVYNIWWLTGLDFTHLAMSVSKRFQDSDKAIVFKFNYTQNRELYEIGHFFNGAMYNPLITATTTGPLDRSTCNFGDYTHNNEIRVLTLCATSRGKIRTNEYLDVNGIKCRYLCPSPTGQFIKENFIRLWSNVTQWPEGRLPLDGENVTINGNWTILMDISPATIDFLLIDGDVIIPDTATETNISAKIIWVRAGSIKAGSSATPHPGKIRIQILGNKEDRGSAINEFIGGNKLFAVHGRVELYGSAPSTIWTRAKATVRAGFNNISVTSSISDWQVGDEIVIGPTFSSPSEHEKVTITSVNPTTNTVTFTPNLNFTHYGATGVTVSNSVGSLDTRAAIGHLSRKIKIVSGADQGWGFHMIVQGYNDGAKLRTGSVALQGVQFLNGGQYDTQNTALKLENTVGTEKIQITKSAFHYCRSYCLDITNINNALVQNNVFYNARVKHVRALKLNSYTFSNNLMISAVKRPTTTEKQLITCYETYDEIQDSSVSITSNLCQGSDLHGFVLPFLPCEVIDSSPYSDNTAGSAAVGFIFSKIDSPCLAATNIKAYACQIGQISSPPGTEKIMFSRFMIADSQRAVTLRFGKQGDDRAAYFSNSYISAISRPTCSECYGPSAIICTGNFGVRMLAVTINGQSLPSKFGSGFDVICRNQVFDSKAFLENIIFENYKQSYTSLPQCSANVIFKPHDIAHDLTGSHQLRNVVCNGCQLNAMALFTPPDQNSLGWSGGCGSILCTGKNNYLINDQTGHLLGSPSVLLANNSVIGDNTDNCTAVPMINGHICRRQDMSVLEYQSIAPDFNTRIMWPVYLKYDGGRWNTSTNGYRQWSWEGNQPLNKRLGRFISVILVNQTYNMTFESQPPIDMRLQIQQKTTSGNPEDWIIVKLKYPRPNSVRVSNRFGVVKPITLLENNGENPLNKAQCGSNKYFYQNYTVHYVVTGDKSCQVRVSLTNSIQLNARIDMDINAFFASDGITKFIDRMCAVLGITDTSRVKVVSVYSGSVDLTAFIDESVSTTTDNSTQSNDAANAQQMAQIQETLSALNSNGSLGSALQSAGLGPLLNLNTQIFYHTDDQIAAEPEKQQQVKVASVAIALIIGIVVGSVVLISVFVGGCVYFMRKRAKIAQVFEIQVSEEKKISSAPEDNESIIDFGYKK